VAAERFLTQDNILGDGERRDEHEMLMHHADALRNRIMGTGDLDEFAVERDRSFVGLVKPVEDVHQRRLARAILRGDRDSRPGCNRISRDRWEHAGKVVMPVLQVAGWFLLALGLGDHLGSLLQKNRNGCCP